MLERIEIENLGAIQKTSVTLSPLTVLVGANASGKTTVMRGIELFAALRQEPLQRVSYAGHPLNREGWATLIHRGDLAKRLVMRACVDRNATEPDHEIQVGINWPRVGTLIASGQSNLESPEPEVLQERLRDPRGEWIEAGTGPYSLRGIRIGNRENHNLPIVGAINFLALIPQNDLADLSRFVESFGTARYFRPSSAAMLTAGDDTEVRPAGEGFVAALAALQNREVERFTAVEEHLRGLFPHIDHIRFQVDKKNVRHLVFQTRRSTRLTPASLEADGVLTTLFLLWAGATTPPHGTLLIDEPEAALHPHLMGKRIDFLRALANGDFTGHPLRVVVATQSVDFVRWLDTSELRVVEYGPETGTLVHPIPDSETLRALTDKFQANAGDLWYSGAIGGTPGTGE
ncbi:AAA family ATPase [Pyxidicoccus sp. 3LFB2]